MIAALILQRHGIPIAIVGPRYYAEAGYSVGEMAGDEWIEVTHWTARQAKEWLGY